MFIIVEYIPFVQIDSDVLLVRVNTDLMEPLVGYWDSYMDQFSMKNLELDSIQKSFNDCVRNQHVDDVEEIVDILHVFADSTDPYMFFLHTVVIPAILVACSYKVGNGIKDNELFGGVDLYYNCIYFKDDSVGVSFSGTRLDHDDA